jgi:cysteine desulfurase/selenocysteine lyase
VIDSLSENAVFDIQRIRNDFPILRQQVNGHDLVYLDNGASTQKPQVVIDALNTYYTHDNSNVHRGAHSLSDRATLQFENARKTVQRFINAAQSEEIIWTKGTTESINLVANTYGRKNLKEGDEILVSAMEHHANIVPWQMLCEQTGAVLKVMPVLANGELDMPAVTSMMTEKVKFVSVVHVSNALGTVNPVKKLIEMAHSVGAKILIDGAQSVAHFPIDVQELDADFFVFSGHKVFGPTGIGVVYGKRELLDAMPPYQGGGEMIEHVSFAGTTYNETPFKFEAGTPHIAGAIGLQAALEYLMQQDRDALSAHEDDLLAYAHSKAEACEGLTLVGTAKQKAGVMSFLLKGAHPADIGMLLDQQGVAIRTGHHCAMPIMEQFKIPGTARASFSIYNTREDVDALFAAIEKIRMFLM